MSDVSDKVAQLVDMGFQPEQAMEALRAAQMNVEAAISILFGEEQSQIGAPAPAPPPSHLDYDTVKILNPGDIPNLSPYNDIDHDKSDFDGTLGEPTPDSSSSNDDIDLDPHHSPGLIDPLNEEVDMIDNDISSSDDDYIQANNGKLGALGALGVLITLTNDGFVEDSISSGVNKRSRHIKSIFDKLNAIATKDIKLLIPFESDPQLNYIGPFLLILLQIPKFQTILFDNQFQFKDYGWSERWASEGKISPMFPTELNMLQFEPFKFLIELQRIGAWFLLPNDLVHRNHISTQSLVESFPKTLGHQVNETNLIEEIVPKVYEGISIGLLGVSALVEKNESIEHQENEERGNNVEEAPEISEDGNVEKILKNDGNPEIDLSNDKNLINDANPELSSKSSDPKLSQQASLISTAIDELMKSVVYSKDDDQSNNVHHIDIELSSSHTSLYDAFNELIWGNDLEQLGQIYFTKLGETLTITNVSDEVGSRNLDFEISETFYPGLYSEKYVDRLVEMNLEKSSQYRQRLEIVKKLNQLNFFEGKKLGNILEKTAQLLEGEAREDMMAFNANLETEKLKLNGQLLEISRSFEENNILNGPALIKKLKAKEVDNSELDPYIIIGIVLSAQQYCYRDHSTDKWVCIKYVENSFRRTVEDVIRRVYDTFEEVKANIDQSCTLTMVFVKEEMWLARKKTIDDDMVPHALKVFFERDNSLLEKQEESEAAEKSSNQTEVKDVQDPTDTPTKGEQLDCNHQEDSFIENVGTPVQQPEAENIT